jgi:hypothetical protein
VSIISRAAFCCAVFGLLVQLSAVTARAQDVCVGDCGGTHSVNIGNLLTLVNIALGNTDESSCQEGIPSGVKVTISTIIQAVNNALGSCPVAPLEFHDTMVTGAGLPVPVALDGMLDASGPTLQGELIATYGGSTATLVAGSDGSIVIHVGAQKMDLLTDDPNFVSINGTKVAVDDALAMYADDVKSGRPPQQWSVVGQSLLTVLALTSSSEFATKIIAASNGAAEASVVSILPAVEIYTNLCKPAAIAASAGAYAFVAARCAAIITAGCVGSIAIGGIPVPCAVALGICGSSAATGVAVPAVAYESVYQFWTHFDTTPTNTATATPTPTATGTATGIGTATGTRTGSASATATATATMTTTASATPTPTFNCTLALASACSLGLVVNPSSAYDGDIFKIASTIDAEHAGLVVREVGTCDGAFDLMFEGGFYSFSFPSSGEGPVPISVFALDASGQAICCQTTSVTGLGPGPDGAPCDHVNTICIGGACDASGHCCGDVMLCGQGTVCSGDLQCDIGLTCQSGTCQPDNGNGG